VVEKRRGNLNSLAREGSHASGSRYGRLEVKKRATTSKSSEGGRGVKNQRKRITSYLDFSTYVGEETCCLIN